MNKKRRIVFIGDSLTEYFDWGRRFPAYDVANLGSAGETVEGLLGRLEEVIAALQAPDALFLMTGINNVAMEDALITDDYRSIVMKLAAASPRALLVVQSMLPVTLSWVDNGIIRSINRELRVIAGEAGTSYLDLYSAFVDAEGLPQKSYLLDDGVHLSTRGYEVWSGIVEELLKVRLLPQ